MTARWSHPAPINVRIAVSNVTTNRIMPDRPRRHDALAHVVAADLDGIEAPEVDVETLELVAKLHAAIATLPDRVRVVVEARLDGATLREAGALIGVSGQRAAQIEREAAYGALREARHGIVRMEPYIESGEWDGTLRTWTSWRVVAA